MSDTTAKLSKNWDTLIKIIILFMKKEMRFIYGYISEKPGNFLFGLNGVWDPKWASKSSFISFLLLGEVLKEREWLSSIFISSWSFISSFSFIAFLSIVGDFLLRISKFAS